MRAGPWRAQNGEEAAVQAYAANALNPGDVQWRERDLEAVFALAHYPEQLNDPWLARELADNPDTAAALASLVRDHAPAGSLWLDVGCGPGRVRQALATAARGPVVGFDIRVGMLRLAQQLHRHGVAHLPWRREAAAFGTVSVHAPPVEPGESPAPLVAGDLYAFPFVAEQFGAVVACSVVDVMPDPLGALEALLALVAPGGVLLVVAPWHFSAASTPPARWWREPAARLARELTARGCAVLATVDDLPWSIPAHARLVHRYCLQGVLVRKPASGR